MPVGSSTNSSASSRGSEFTAPTSADSRKSETGAKRKATEEKQETEGPKTKIPKTKLSKDKRMKDKVSKGKKEKNKRLTTTTKTSKREKEIESSGDEPEESCDEDLSNTPFSFAASDWVKLKVDDLDLGKSYVGKLPALSEKPKTEEKPERQTRWTHKGSTPLLDVSKLPEGWNAREPDLDPQ